MSNDVIEFPGDVREAPVIETPTRPLYWSVLRELWENKSIYIAPLIVAGVIMFGFMASTIGMPHRRQAVLQTAEENQRVQIAKPYDVGATMLFFTAVVVGIFYCLDALHGERRDRSILFWKSLPVSDRTTVLSKLAVPLVIEPAITFVVVVTVQIFMLLFTSMVLAPSGLAGTTWSHVNLFVQSIILLYGLITTVLWHAPIYCWLLLVSGWAKRAPFLWAVAPFAMICMLEAMMLRTSYFAKFIGHRFAGLIHIAYDFPKNGHIYQFSQLTPLRFLSTPGLWLGLIAAAALIAATIRLRRDREPI